VGVPEVVGMPEVVQCPLYIATMVRVMI